MKVEKVTNTGSNFEGSTTYSQLCDGRRLLTNLGGKFEVQFPTKILKEISIKCEQSKNYNKMSNP